VSHCQIIGFGKPPLCPLCPGALMRMLFGIAQFQQNNQATVQLSPSNINWGFMFGQLHNAVCASSACVRPAFHLSTQVVLMCAACDS
jgi:hypothetical protein